MKPDEEHVRRAVERYLQLQHPSSTVTVEEGADPPDYVVTLGDRCFCLEATAIVATVVVGGREHTEVGLFAALTRTAESLCSQLESQPWLSGTYVVHLEPVPDLMRQLPALAEACTAYAQETAALDTAPAQQLPFHWSIKKYSNARRFVSFSLSAAEPSWEGEIDQELRALVNRAVGRKQERAARQGGVWVLALLDRYHVALERNWRSAVEAAGDHDFAAILHIDGEGDCRPLSGDIAVADLPLSDSPVSPRTTAMPSRGGRT